MDTIKRGTNLSTKEPLQPEVTDKFVEDGVPYIYRIGDAIRYEKELAEKENRLGVWQRLKRLALLG